jgi:hypothetical protein
MRKALVLGVLTLAGTLASPAFADEFSGFRLGINMDSNRLESDLFFAPLVATDQIDTKRFAYGLSAGWGLNKWLAFEGSLQGGSQFNQHVFQPMLAAPEDFVVSHTDLMGAELSVVGSVWIGSHVSFFARAGMFAWKADETVSVGNYVTDTRPAAKVSASADDTGYDPIFGVGIQTQLDGALMRVEYKQTEIGDLGLAGGFNLHDSTVSSLSFSIVWILH